MIKSDEPISSPADDVLGRDHTAKVIASEIRALDASRGAVVGILGPWGSGKTSLVNLVRSALGEEPSLAVLDFNPWMFSGADQLVESFFVELAAQFRVGPSKLKGIADALDAYSGVVGPLRFLPVVGPWIERARGASKELKAFYENRRKGITQVRAVLDLKLRDLDAPIVVVVDDIDRLNTAEIRDVFKLVRLTASFPNVIYLLAFDRARVEQALAEDGLPGRDYLEKIIQVTYDIPAIPSEALGRQLAAALSEALDEIENVGKFESDRWPDVFAEVIRPLVRNMRDVRRYVASLRGTVVSLGGRVALVDVLGMEAIRVFLPDVFDQIALHPEALTTPAGSHGMGYANDPALKAVVEALVESAGPQSATVRSAIMRLFPAARRHIENNHYGSEWLKTWLADRYIAHPQILSYYLERVAGAELQASWVAELAFFLMHDAEHLDEFLRSSISTDELRDVIAGLEAYEDRFTDDQVVPTSIVLLNLLPDLPERAPSMFDFGDEMAVTRVVFRLLRRLRPEAVEPAVREILPEVHRLRDRFTLLMIVGHQQGAGHKLVSEDVASELERDLRSDVRSASPADLAADAGAFRLLWWVTTTAADDEPSMEVPTHPKLIQTLFKGSVGKVRSQMMGSRAVNVTPQLSWETLTAVFGDEATIATSADLVEELALDDEAFGEVVALVRKYLTGYRPRDFGDIPDHDDDDVGVIIADPSALVAPAEVTPEAEEVDSPDVHAEPA